MTTLENLKIEIAAEFEKRFGVCAQWFVSAPGRVNLIGEHTDYNDGFVFPMAIERYTIIAAAPTPDNFPKTDAQGRKIAHIITKNLNKSATVLLEGDIQPSDRVRWPSYVQGTIACALEKGIGVDSFCAVLYSTVPIGGSLSSSASLEVSIATLLQEISGKNLSGVDKALLCQKAEHEFAKMPCGIMDQYISAMAQENHAMLLDCRSLAPEMIPLSDPNIVVLIINSNVKHSLSGSEYPERRQSCEEAARILGVAKLRDATPEMVESAKAQLCSKETGDRYYRRAKHVVTEDLRTQTMAQALIRSDWKTVGQQMYASHDSLKNDYEVSCPELDTIVELAREIGADGGIIGARMTGGGFGGCVVSLVYKEAVPKVTELIAQKYLAKTGIEPTIFATQPAQGATVLR